MSARLVPASTEYFYTTVNPTENFATFTACGWHRRTDQNGWRSVMCFNSGADARLLIWNGTTLEIYDSVTEQAFDAAPNNDTWFFWAITGSGLGNPFKGYWMNVGGSTWAGTATIAVPADGSIGSVSTIYIGQDGANEPGEGDFQHVKIWKGVALSEGQLLAEMYSAVPRYGTNLWAWYPFTGTSSTRWTQNFATGTNTLTINGTPDVVGPPPCAWGGLSYPVGASGGAAARKYLFGARS